MFLIPIVTKECLEIYDSRSVLKLKSREEEKSVSLCCYFCICYYGTWSVPFEHLGLKIWKILNLFFHHRTKYTFQFGT